MTMTEALLKVSKLLKKGNDGATTPAEAAAFMAKAQQLINEHNLDINSLSFEADQAAEDAEPIKDFGYDDPLDISKYGNYQESWGVRLAGIVARSNQCRILYRRQADKSSIIKIIGRASDVQTVRYLNAFFKTQIIDLVSANTKGNSSAYKGQFANGCIDALNEKLNVELESLKKQKKEEQANNPLALVKVNNAIARIEKRAADVTKFMEEPGRYKLGGKAFQGSSTAVSGRGHGQQVGKSSLKMAGGKGSIGGGHKQLGN